MIKTIALTVFSILCIFIVHLCLLYMTMDNHRNIICFMNGPIRGIRMVTFKHLTQDLGHLTSSQGET